jgi:hypothetical protein
VAVDDTTLNNDTDVLCYGQRCRSGWKLLRGRAYTCLQQRVVTMLWKHRLSLTLNILILINLILYLCGGQVTAFINRQTELHAKKSCTVEVSSGTVQIQNTKSLFN